MQDMTMITLGNDVQIAYDSHGDEADPLLLLISGAGSPAAFWPDGFCADLAGRGFRVVRFDHRDTGLSTHFDDPYDIRELLDDLDGLLDALGGTGAVLIGHSMGGYLAQMKACRDGSSIRGVVSISAGSAVDDDLCRDLGMGRPTEETWRVLMRNEPTGDFDADLDGWLRIWRSLNGRVPFDRERAVAYTQSLYRGDPRNARVAVNHVHAMTTVPVRLVTDLTALRRPLLALHGTEDVLVPPDNGAVTARLAPLGRFVGLDGSGHMFFDGRTWNLIRDHVLEFIVGVCARTPVDETE